MQVTLRAKTFCHGRGSKTRTSNVSASEMRTTTARCTIGSAFSIKQCRRAGHRLLSVQKSAAFEAAARHKARRKSSGGGMAAQCALAHWVDALLKAYATIPDPSARPNPRAAASASPPAIHRRHGERFFSPCSLCLPVNVILQMRNSSVEGCGFPRGRRSRRSSRFRHALCSTRDRLEMPPISFRDRRANPI